MKRFSFATFILLASLSSFTFAEHSPETLQQAIAKISLKDHDAEQQALALLSSVQQQQQPALTAQALLFVMRAQRKNRDFDGVKASYQKLALMTEENQLYKAHAQGLLLLAKSERMIDKNDVALKIIEQQALPLAKAHAPELLGNIYTEAANNVALIPDFEKFEPYFQLAIETLKKEQDFKKSARMLAIKANHLSSYGNIKAALPALMSAIKEQLALDDKSGLFLSYTALGTLHHEIENYQQALAYFQKARDLGHESARNLASLNYKMAFSYYKLQQYDEGIAYMDNALGYMVNHSSKKDLATVHLGKVLIFIEQQNYIASLSTLNKVKALVKDVNSERVHEDLQTSFANYYLAVGDIPSAVKSIQASLAFETTHIAMNIEKYETASDIYEQAGDYAKSLFYLKKLREFEREKAQVKDEQRVFQQQNEINLLNAQKNTALVKQQLLEKQNQVQLQQAEQQKLWFYAGMSALCLFALFSFFYLRQSQKKRIALEQSKLVMALMEQKNQFIANVAHDLKNPITVIQIHLEALKDGMVKNPEQAHDILSQRLAELTNSIEDLRQVSLLEMGALSLNPEALLFKSWLQQEINAYRPLVESKGLSFRVSIKLEGTAIVIADPGRLSQVFANIIKNSLRYTHQPGKLTIIARQHQQTVELLIKDSAPAVAESELNDLFSHSYCSKKTQAMSTQSSGLGLYICKQIIEAHQGEISASLSNLGGLCINITMPLADE
ncbi:ATP-binding protein [Thalassomonas actiniarum]|uniref:histidine kinase n=1 Tax=Thalassomonas actiniarum TaxID=485447 RepID=A0AAE9YY15_9GAMM|nr:ATP-binding protein [Thalassomonas actiniarum]WDE02449.1 two-component sensor histidine kinase [Thalassomonas actiniarum]